jgi:hypothetical protein
MLNSLIQTHLTTNTSEANNILASHHTTTVPGFWAAWRWWLLPSLAGVLLVLYFVDPFIGDWDGIDYTMLSLAGYPSSMALGRNLFIFSNHILFVLAQSLFQLQPENAYLLFKYAVVAQAPFAVIGCWYLSLKLTKSVYAATIAALLIVFSPVFVLYGGQVMTDVPSVLLLTTALLVHIRGIQRRSLWQLLLAAALMGLGMNLRETIGFYVPWLIVGPFAFGWKLRGRELLYVLASCVVFVAFAFGWFGYWFLTDPHYRTIWHGWRESMREESSRHPVALANLRPFVMYLFITAPLVFLTLPFAPFSEWRKRRFSPLLALWLVGLLSDLLLFFNYSTTVNWRYFLTGLPGLVPLSALWLFDLSKSYFRTPRRAFIACSALIVGFALMFVTFMRPVSFEFIERRAMSRDYKHRLAQVPPDAVMISGAQTIAVTYWAAIGAGKWKTIGTGGGWPGDRLFSVIDDHLQSGKRVFLDSDPRWWLPCGWQRDEIPIIVDLEGRFNFRRVNDTIFELRPLSDSSATDKPELRRLLPENRPEDTKKCPPGRT